MRAGRFDIVVETGAAYTRAVQVMSPLAGIPASTVAPDSYVYLDGWPRSVYSVDTVNGKTTIAFGQGLWSDERLTVDQSALVQPAEPVVITDAQAGFYVPLPTQPIEPPDPPIDTVIPVIIAADGLSLEIDMGADLTATYAPLVGAHSWDLFAQTAAWDWQRVLEGTFVIVKGDAR
jgi:hypothetical protein